MKFCFTFLISNVLFALATWPPRDGQPARHTGFRPASRAPQDPSAGRRDAARAQFSHRFSSASRRVDSFSEERSQAQDISQRLHSIRAASGMGRRPQVPQVPVPPPMVPGTSQRVPHRRYPSAHSSSARVDPQRVHIGVRPGMDSPQAFNRVQASAPSAARRDQGAPSSRPPRDPSRPTRISVRRSPPTPQHHPAAASSGGYPPPPPARQPSARPPSARPPSAGPPSARAPSAGPPSAGPPSARQPSARPPSDGRVSVEDALTAIHMVRVELSTFMQSLLADYPDLNQQVLARVQELDLKMASAAEGSRFSIDGFIDEIVRLKEDLDEAAADLQYEAEMAYAPLYDLASKLQYLKKILRNAGDLPGFFEAQEALRVKETALNTLSTRLNEFTAFMDRCVHYEADASIRNWYVSLQRSAKNMENMVDGDFSIGDVLLMQGRVDEFWTAVPQSAPVRGQVDEYLANIQRALLTAATVLREQ